jgi:ketosteroid isomerase-like protein
MGQPSVELVRELIDAVNRADVAAFLARVHPDFEWRTLESSPVAGVYKGHEAVRRYVEDWLTTFEGLRIDIDEISEVDDQVLVVVRGHARGRGSGIEVENHLCQVWALRDGAPVAMREYETRERALTQLQ